MSAAKFSSHRGFTLVEVMVVLSLVSLISVIVLQMMTILLKSYDQISRMEGQSALESMRNNWFRGSVNAMVASLDQEFEFRGARKLVSGYTTSPLMGRQGMLTSISWEIREDATQSTLWYIEHSKRPLQISTWDNARAEFSYRGLKSGWVEAWPPSELPEGVLPHRVKLTIHPDDALPMDIYAAINIRRTGRFDYRDNL